MTDEEYEKKVKETKTFCILLGIVFAATLFIGISQENYVGAILAVIFLVVLYLFYSLTKKRKIVGPVIGIILGIVYIIQPILIYGEIDIISIIIGISILADCLSMYKYIKDINK